ncbi:MAG: hypothetical protein RLZZ387_3939 [Chloroflexota bacterium]|jgi:hypothetical protein
MNTDAGAVAARMYELLPAVYRLRDAERGYPLRELIAVVAEQVTVVQEGLEQAYDNLFIETCAEWVVPYIGDLIGARPLHGRAPGVAGGRADVADTLGLRRRKGTLAALEQTARAVTGYPAVAVEFFLRLAQTQWMNHARPENLYTVDMRDELALERIAGPFERAARTVEVRRIASARGCYNFQNIGIFLFRIQSLPLVGVSAGRVDDRRYTFSPLGIDSPLYSNPIAETAMTQFAGPEHVPLPLTRLALRHGLPGLYGPNSALLLTVDGVPVPAADVRSCDLSDDPGAGGWAHASADHYGVDPVLGRIATPTNNPVPTDVVVSYRHGFSDTIGGGAYERGAEIAAAATETVSASSPDVQAALDTVAGGGVLEFADSRTYELATSTPNLMIADDARVEIRARNGQRPTLRLTGGDLTIDAAAGAELALDGLVLLGGALRITGAPKTVTLRHCTLVPGIERTREGTAARPGEPSLVITAAGAEVALESCISGPIRAANGARMTVRHSIIDADDPALPVFGGDGEPGGALVVEGSTLIGRVHTRLLEHASNAIFVAAGAGGELPVRSERTQEGCVRFSAVPEGSRVPRRHRCTSAAARFTSLRFGAPGYCQLATSCDEAIRRGADDESEMGVFHDLFQPQRESDLRTRLDEFLRFGMEPGIFYAS